MTTRYNCNVCCERIKIGMVWNAFSLDPLQSLFFNLYHFPSTYIQILIGFYSKKCYSTQSIISTKIRNQSQLHVACLIWSIWAVSAFICTLKIDMYLTMNYCRMYSHCHPLPHLYNAISFVATIFSFNLNSYNSTVNTQNISFWMKYHRSKTYTNIWSKWHTNVKQQHHNFNFLKFR